MSLLEVPARKFHAAKKMREVLENMPPHFSWEKIDPDSFFVRFVLFGGRHGLKAESGIPAMSSPPSARNPKRRHHLWSSVVFVNERLSDPSLRAFDLSHARVFAFGYA